MIKLTNEINRHRIMYLFRDGDSAFFDSKFYKYIDVQYIYDAMAKVLESTPYRLDDPNHVTFFIKENHKRVQFEYAGIDKKGEEIDIVIIFDDGETDDFLVEISMGAGYIDYKGYDI